jgi:cobalt-zinc-cadmium efflux system membrane fusion protein
MAISSQAADPGSRNQLGHKAVRHVIVSVLAGLGLIAVVAIGWRALSSAASTGGEPRPSVHPPNASVSAQHDETKALPLDAVVRMGVEQQQAIGLKTETVKIGNTRQVVAAPGRVAPNETQYAHITPRAPGVVRSVTVHIGQSVKAGDLLATIDSPVVGDARLELYTRLQALNLAKAQADWQQTIYENTLALIERLKRGESPEQIHEAFTDKALGENREKLMTAYAQYRLAIATMERNRELFAQKLITPKQFEQVKATYEVAQATYQGLMDQMGFTARLENTRAQQAKRQAETSVRAAQERLRILGVKPDGTEPEVQGGKIVGVKPDGTLPASDPRVGTAAESSERVLPTEKENIVVAPVGDPTQAANRTVATPVSTYSIWAPFDGTILDREMIVPGVAVDTTHRIFTLADLSSIWVEANIHESDFGTLSGNTTGTKVRFYSPAYPGVEFVGEVIYSGDLVEDMSRTVKLLARAENPDRKLKPGMFVNVEIVGSNATPTVQVPASAVLMEDDDALVFVRVGPEEFVERRIAIDAGEGELVAVRDGLKLGEEVVVEGAFKLKALASRLAKAE